ncbi:hypothetical protein [Flavobacterium phage V157]|uniref:Uncharacterized protein n=12 Tax=Ficleduovirus FCV1 TaxID=2560474 RepID=A0A218M8F7_9CAUD|nr:hypothetical protein FDG55_gp52 [Flavobacterium phage FCV-1]ASD51635.1 hypothetical protein [Flavobacterium phage FCV-3]ASD51709.1 hypothetical protein [Flavobacterium phage FCV-11]ASD51783.1 hypothetical protein [Flavobacterium phage V175]ASD51861.1 hypothetical protein [Flavobacterium phage V181]ASD52539.1 hypothetical protein [Flavobacterium phage FCV-10]ASD52612.1 hypothetical protein [Flavobacterium phage FCV-16]ASD52686.1 hypothetical protein [Flavobacterium phage FCV-20]ASD52759.1
MKHTISKKLENTDIVELSITELIEEKKSLISILKLTSENNCIEENNIELNSKELHSFIGALLHVQSKIK